jgi:hypothetical protein
MEWRNTLRYCAYALAPSSVPDALMLSLQQNW